MKYIGELLRGMVIGIANILPGISGGMLAITMGVYDKIIHAVTHLFKEPVKSIRLLLPYGVGALTGIIFLSLVFEYLFHTYPLQTKLLFLGLIAGGLPSLYEKTQTAHRGERRKGIIISCVTCDLVAGESIIGGMSLSSGDPKAAGEVLTGAAYLSSGAYWPAFMFLVGVLAAGTMVIPGVSGSMIMMMIGVYEPLLQTNNACIRAVAAFDVEGLIPNVLVLLPYFIGLAGGVFLFAVIVEHFLTKHERLMYRFIIGLVYSSPFVILWDMPWESVEAYQLLIGVSLALLGYEAADLLGGEG